MPMRGVEVAPVDGAIDPALLNEEVEPPGDTGRVTSRGCNEEL